MKNYDPREWKFKVGQVLALASVAGIGAYGFSLYRLAKNIVVSQRVRIHKIDGRGISIAVEAQIHNPTGTMVEMEQPFVKILEVPDGGDENSEKKKRAKGRVLASSKPSSETYTVAKKTITRLDPIIIQVPYESLLHLAAGNVAQKKEIKLKVEISSLLKLKYFLSYTLLERQELVIPVINLPRFLNQKVAAAQETELGILKLN